MKITAELVAKESKRVRRNTNAMLKREARKILKGMK